MSPPMYRGYPQPIYKKSDKSRAVYHSTLSQIFSDRLIWHGSLIRVYRLATNLRKNLVWACPVSYLRSRLFLNSIFPTNPHSRPTSGSSTNPLPPPIPSPFHNLPQIDEEEENEVWEVLVSSDQNSWKTVAQESLPSSIVRKTSLSALESQVRNQLSSEMQKVC